MRRLLKLLLCSLPAILPLSAQVPHLLNYQGRVAVGGQNFTGQGQFKFALVNSNGTTAYWKNDGPPGNIVVPPFGVTVPVQNGHYSVQLGDTLLNNMQALPPEVFTQHTDVRLRVWFSDGINGFQALTPDQRIAAVGYAIMADDIKNGAVTAAKMAYGAARDNLAASGLSAVPHRASVVSENWNDSNLINAGYVQVGELTGGVENSWRKLPSAPEKRYAHTMCAQGASQILIWGGMVEPAAGGPAAVSNTGSWFDISTQAWTAMTTTGAPAPRSRHAALMADDKMYVWGGSGAPAFLGDGGAYDLYTNSWTAIPATPFLTARRDHSAVLIGSEIIFYGGETSAGLYAGTGARYNIATSTWTQLPIGPGSPSSRARHTAIVSDNKMYVWGGIGSAGVTNTGSIYDPATNTWTAMSTTGAPLARAGHTMQAYYSAGTTRLMVWGGENAAGTPVAGGGIYDIASNSWLPVEPLNAPSARSGSTLSLAGMSLMVWGGQNGATYYGSAGFLYDHSNNKWSLTETFNSPAARAKHGAATTYANRVYIQGGTNGQGAFDDFYVWIPRRTVYLYERL